MTEEQNHTDPSVSYAPFPVYYRLGVGLMIINSNRQVFVGHRQDSSTLPDGSYVWQMPQGGIDYNETPYEAAIREMKEEIGTENVKLIAETKDWLTYQLPKELSSRLWGGRFDGQKQKWFLFDYLGNDCDININTRHPEFSQWKWVDYHLLPDLIVPFKKDVYEQVLTEFKPFLSAL